MRRAVLVWSPLEATVVLARSWRGCFGLGLASFAADTRQSFGKKAGGDIDFAAFYILPVPSSLSAKWRRVEIGSLPSFSPSRRITPKHATPRTRNNSIRRYAGSNLSLTDS